MRIVERDRFDRRIHRRDVNGIADQTVVTNLVQSQRDSVSAVSMDEEMTDLVKFQRAYQASAQVVNVINEMLDTVINMMR